MNINRKDFLKLGAATLAGTALASALPATSASANTLTQFKDVPASLSGVVNSASSSGILLGYGDGTFRPYENISRIALIVALWRMTYALSNQTPFDNPDYGYGDPVNLTNWYTDSTPQAFVDVPRSHPFFQYAQWAYYAKIAQGTIRNGKRYLDAEKPATRLDAAIFFQRVLDKRVATTAPDTKISGQFYPLYESRTFKDIPTNHYAYRQVAWFTTTHIASGGGYKSRYNKGENLGIASGYPDSTFRPNELVPRWVVATFWDRIAAYAWRGA